MLLNNGIQLFFCSNDFKLSKGNKCNYVRFLFFLKVNSNHFIWTKSQKDMNFQSLCFCNV
jgi:hypothetical protein